MQQYQINNLSFIRALSGFVVVASHYSQIFIMPIYGRNVILNALSALSLYAVLTFFALSSLLIAMSLDSNIERNNGIFHPMEYALYTLSLIHFHLMLFFYAAIRSLWNSQSFFYFLVSALFSIFLIPISHYLSGILENRKYWERLILNIGLKLHGLSVRIFSLESRS